MTLHIDSISFDQFRGYTHLELSDLGKLTLIVGPNAVGKTNIVEGIQLLTSGESFRKPSWDEVVLWGCDWARLSGRFTDGKRVVEHTLTVEGNKRLYEVNGKKKASGDIKGTLPAVLFTPDDLQMVKAASSRRRTALDAFAAQLSKNYASIKKDYTQALRQKNLLIRDGLASGALFDSWNESLIVNGSRLMANRHRLFMRIAAAMCDIYRQVVPGESFEVCYLPSWNRFDEEGRQLKDVASNEAMPACEELSVDDAAAFMAAALTRMLPMELQRGTSLIGPHKDEIVFFINGKNARLFASQGQQRTIVLVWKLAELLVVYDIMGSKPVLLLDDVMSELDEAHRDELSAFIEQAAQTFITTTNLGYFNEALLSRADVIKMEHR